MYRGSQRAVLARSDKMKKCVITFPSYTYAVKAFKLLRSRGFECKIVRNGHSSDTGCGYSLEARGESEKIRGILEDYTIPYKDLGNEVL